MTIKPCYTLFTFLLTSPLWVTAQSPVSLDEVRQAGLRVVEVTTEGGEEPQGEEIASPVKENTYNYTYTNKVRCQVVITLYGDTLYNSGTYEKDSCGATIRINGNTSAYYSNPLNMPYKLKLEKKADLLLRGDSTHYSDKNWRLLKDAFSLNTIVGLKVSQLIGMEWTAAFTPCNLIINGDYRGCYLLIESVKRNPRCRINTDKEQGYIVERDPYWWKEQHYFVTQWYEEGSTYRWTWKYPDDDLITEEKEQYIQLCLNQAEQGIHDGTYDKFIDPTSFAKWLLAHDILGTRDSGGSNMFIKKYDESDSTRFEMPCLWDFDSNFAMTVGTFSRHHISSNSYFSTLLQSDKRVFAQTYVTLWNKLKDDLAAQMIDFIDAYTSSDEAKALETSRNLYNRRWGYSYPSMNTYSNQATQWFVQHLPLLDKKIQMINKETGIERVKSQTDDSFTTCYTLQGIRIIPNNESHPYRQSDSHHILFVKYADGSIRKIRNHENSLY
jgi:hypothetical protein